MKLFLISIALILAVYVGNFSIFLQTKFLSKLVVFLLLSVSLFINIFSPILSNIDSATYLIKNNYSKTIPILISDEIKSELINSKSFYYNGIHFKLINNIKYENENIIYTNLYKNLEGNNIANIHKVENLNYNFYFPFIPGIENYIKIFTFHITAAWLAFFAFICSLIFSIKYLKNNNLEMDFKTYLYAKYGFIFCIIATILGMIWAKHSWGAYWNWDPRQISIFLLLSIYLAYFVLRQSIPHKIKKAKFSSVYAIFAAFSSPFFIFIIPRLVSGLHPGSANDKQSPILSSQQSMINNDLLVAFIITLFAFTLFFYFMFNKSILKHKKNIEI